MSKPRRIFVVWMPLVLAVTACTESPQATTGIRSDAPAFQGTNMPFAAGGWKQGDRNSWEQQLKVRAQMGQNDYAKVN